MKFTLHFFRCLAATLAVAGVLRETTAQETLTIEYTTRSWSEPVRHFVEVEKDIREFGRTSGHILHQHFGIMTTLILPEGMPSLEDLDLRFFRRNAVGAPPGYLTHLVLPKSMPSLESLRLSSTDELTHLVLPKSMPSLKTILIQEHQSVTNIFFPNGMTNLETIEIRSCRLSSLILPEGLSNLKRLNLRWNALTNLTLPEGLSNLEELNLEGSQLTNLTLPEGLSNLKRLNLESSDPTQLKLPKLLRVPAGMNIDNLRIVFTLNFWRRKEANAKWWIENGELQDPSIRIEFYGASPPSPPDEPSPPRLSYRRLANGLELSFEGGTLQSAPTITGPWQDVGSSGSAFHLFSSSPAEFFRVIKP